MRTKALYMILTISLLLMTSCGGGGGGSKARVFGTTTDNFGAIVGGNNVTIVLEGLSDVYHPDINGNFDFSVPPATYQIEFLWYDSEQGIEINNVQSRTLVQGDNDFGQVKLTNNFCTAGWSAYRAGDYLSAIDQFNSYLADVRNGHANAGSNSALAGLGWSYSRLEDFNSSFANFNAALTASGGNNVDALVGLGGMFLSLGFDGTNYTYGTSNIYLTSALNLNPNYSSAPTHDAITSTDVYAARALARFMDGDIAGCQADIARVRQTADAEGNFATLDTLNMLEWMIGNI